MGKPMRNCGRKANWLECDLAPALDMPSGHRWHTAQPGAREGIEKTLTIALKLDKIKRTKHKFKMESLVEIEEKKQDIADLDIADAREQRMSNSLEEIVAQA